MIIKHPRLIIKQHGTIKNYRYVGDVSPIQAGKSGDPRSQNADKNYIKLLANEYKSKIDNITAWNNQKL